MGMNKNFAFPNYQVLGKFQVNPIRLSILKGQYIQSFDRREAAFFTHHSLLFNSLLVAFLLVTCCFATHYSFLFHSLLVSFTRLPLLFAFPYFLLFGDKNLLTQFASDEHLLCFLAQEKKQKHKSLKLQFREVRGKSLNKHHQHSISKCKTKQIRSLPIHEYCKPNITFT